MESIPSLVDFRSPPVVEVVCGVQFARLPSFGAVHLGLLWGRLREEFPNLRELPPVPLVMENLGAQPTQSFPFNFGGALMPRAQFHDATGGQFIQVQSGRFMHNWQKVHAADDYRRYRAIRPSFTERWEAFRRFVADEKLGELQLDQYTLQLCQKRSSCSKTIR